MNILMGNHGDAMGIEWDYNGLYIVENMVIQWGYMGIQSINIQYIKCIYIYGLR